VVLLDTSFVVALENRRDPHHERAKSWDRELLEEGCVSSIHWGVLLEIGDGYSRLGRRSKGFEIIDRLLNEERYHVVPLTEELVQHGLDLYLARTDKDWGLTDCISFALMNSVGISDALTDGIHLPHQCVRASEQAEGLYDCANIIDCRGSCRPSFFIFL